MNANKEDDANFPLKEEVYTIVGCAFEVLRELGHGLREKSYERSLVVEFGLRGIAWDQQRPFPIIYKGVEVDVFIPDLILLDRIVVDTKTIERISDIEIGQMLNYLKITGLPVGLILNFKHARLEWRRVVLDPSRFKSHLRPFASIRGSFSD